MPTISKDNDLVTVILVFKVDPNRQQDLLEAGIANSQNVMETKPGFISASFHKSFDGNSVVNYAQWETKKQYEEAINFLSQDEVKYGEKIFDIADPDWNIYELTFSSGQSPTEISINDELVTVVNLFNVEPQNQQKLVSILELFSSQFVEKQPSFISANVHKSIDGKRVVSYAQWKNKEDYQSIYANKDATPYLDDIKKIAKFSWNFYEVVYTVG